MRASQRREAKRFKTGDEGFAILPHSTAGIYLLQLQRFFEQFIFYDNPNINVLKEDEKFILRQAKSCECPKQLNSVDCSLFGFVVTLLIYFNIKVESSSFLQSEISEFRIGLFDMLSADTTGLTFDPKKEFHYLLFALSSPYWTI